MAVQPPRLYPPRIEPLDHNQHRFHCRFQYSLPPSTFQKVSQLDRSKRDYDGTSQIKYNTRASPRPSAFAPPSSHFHLVSGSFFCQLISQLFKNCWLDIKPLLSSRLTPKTFSPEPHTNFSQTPGPLPTILPHLPFFPLPAHLWIGSRPADLPAVYLLAGTGSERYKPSSYL